MAGSASFLSPIPPSNAHSPHRFLPQSPNTVSAAAADSSTLSFRAPSRFRCLLAECGDAQGRGDPSDSLLTEKPWLLNSGSVKAPTAPWMRGPLVLPAEHVLDLSKPRWKKRSRRPSKGSLTEKVRGGRSKQTMKKIVQSIVRLGEISHLGGDVDDEEDDGDGEEEGVKGDVPNFPLERLFGSGEEETVEEGALNRKLPWVGSEKPMVFPRVKKQRVVTAAEMVLPEEFLMRLRMEARKLTKWVKAKKAGVTDDVVDEIRATWRGKELAMVKFVEPLCRNMDRAREIVEVKTGGLVVWSKRNSLVVFRGKKYDNTSKFTHIFTPADGEQSSSSTLILEKSGDSSKMSSTRNNIINGMLSLDERENDHSQSGSMIGEVIDHPELISGTLYEREVNRLLDGLGPRFIDWWWPKPLPVDADLLPEVVPDFKPPFRLCPPHVRPKLTDDELTYLRKLARPLPTHFALGKNSKLQGLAAAIIKLWEKSLIAKIAVKRGIPKTDDEQMADELKHLTGGIVILRNKFFIILYGGKDFVPPNVASPIFDRERELKDMHRQEEEARGKATETIFYSDGSIPTINSSGTLKEFQNFKTNYGYFRDGDWETKVKIEAEKERLEKELGRQERKLQLLKLKIDKSEKELAQLNFKWRPSKEVVDQEFLTEEERQTYRRIGLKMDEVLLLGRRGVYDGTIGSIHMHWKHREVVKVITMQEKFSQVTFTASLLETVTGGILVAVEKLRKGHAIILYRGKNYQAPIKLLTDNLLTKKKALERSIQIQRRGSLKFFAYRRQQSIWELKAKLSSLERTMEDLNYGVSLSKL